MTASIPLQSTPSLTSAAPRKRIAEGLAAQASDSWSGQRIWHVLQTHWDDGLVFLTTWRAWRHDPQHPPQLFFSAVTETIPRIGLTLSEDPLLTDLAQQLAHACVGLMPGSHRLVFEGGLVQLTLVVGPLGPALREMDVAVDTVLWHPTEMDALASQNTTAHPPSETSSETTSPSALQTLQAIARVCRRGAQLWTVSPLQSTAARQCGFDSVASPQDAFIAGSVDSPKGSAATPGRACVAVYAPPWAPRSRLRQAQAPRSRQAVVIGAGLSGSAVAHSLALRGWQVTVLDAGDAVGAGASGLPAGLVAPHVSPDDSVLSRITRAGVRSSLQRATQLLREGIDWAPSGVLEHRVEGKRSLPAGQAWSAQAHAWSTHASPERMAQAGLPPEAPGVWHGLAGWVLPRQLVNAQLQTPGIQVLWQQTVARIQSVQAPSNNESPLWQVMNDQGKVLATAPCVILASAYNSHRLLQGLCDQDEKPAIPLNPLRGQISYGLVQDLPPSLRQQLPPFPVNGHGSFISGVPTPAGSPGWFIGATFERNCQQAPVRDEDHAANRQRLTTLLPTLGRTMQDRFEPGQILGWAGLRCTLPDRLPAVGPVNAERWPGLWMVAGMGARGISLAVLCGELSAALLDNEPLPLPPDLARHLMAERFVKTGLRQTKESELSCTGMMSNPDSPI